MIDFPESIEESVVYLKKALPKLSQHELPTNPLNYALWYTYASERIPELNYSIDQLVGSESGYTPAHASALFHRYILSDDEKAGYQAVGKLQRVAQSMTQQLAGVLQSTESLDHHLRASGAALGAAQTRSEIVDVLHEATTAFELLRWENESVRTTLQETQRELDGMKSELERMRNSADTDPLTKLSNRTAIDRILGSRIAAMKPGGQLSFIMCDIDHFKRFNDQFGHLMGDRVLQRVGALILAHVRTSTLAARYGGEELVIIVPDASLDEAAEVAERLRDHIERLRVKVRGTDQILNTITASFGVATYHVGDTVENLFDRADKAMYMSKAAGRNTVRTEESNMFVERSA